MQHLLQPFQLKSIYGTEVLHAGDLPVLCYMVGFAKSSNILEPVLVGTTGNHIKDVTLLPFAHEFERNVAAAAFLASADCINVRAWEDGVKIQTRWRPVDTPAGIPAVAGPSSA